MVLLGLVLFVSNWAAGLPSFQIILLALFPVILCAGRGVLRLAAVLDLLPEWREKLLAYGWAWTLLAPLVPFVYLYNTIVAAFTRTITWRGIRYELISPRQTHILPAELRFAAFRRAGTELSIREIMHSVGKSSCMNARAEFRRAVQAVDSSSDRRTRRIWHVRATSSPLVRKLGFLRYRRCGEAGGMF